MDDPVRGSSSVDGLTVLIDGTCPICRREADVWRRLDGGRGRLRLEDFAATGGTAARLGLSQTALAEQIHAVLPDGSVVCGMEVFRRAYAAVGLGWLLAPTGWPLLRPVFDAGYRWFARNRPRLGRLLRPSRT